MKIKSNALPQEFDSPFYKKNELFCQVFEHFIASKKGRVKGTYNAWSYVIYGKIETNNAWDLKYKKAVYTGTGNLLLSSKSQNLLTLAEWTCTTVNTKETSFFIRRRKFTDRIKPAYKRLERFPMYVIKRKGKQSRFTTQVLQVLNPLFEIDEIYRITLKNNKLTIELRSESHHFDIFDELLQLS